MFFLENAWLLPAIPAASFLLILFFGKRLPKMLSGGVACLSERKHLGMGAAGLFMPALADLAAVFHDHRTDGRIGPRQAFRAPGEPQRQAHPFQIGFRETLHFDSSRSSRASTNVFGSNGTRSSAPSPRPA